jgi:hypothetical protein
MRGCVLIRRLHAKAPLPYRSAYTRVFFSPEEFQH